MTQPICNEIRELGVLVAVETYNPDGTATRVTYTNGKVGTPEPIDCPAGLEFDDDPAPAPVDAVAVVPASAVAALAAALNAEHPPSVDGMHAALASFAAALVPVT